MLIVPNKEAIPNLREDAVVEVPSVNAKVLNLFRYVLIF